MKARRAFTLIELLVVVSIIALLVSILLPSLSKARDHAKNAVCMMNLRSIGQIMVLYANDFNGRLTPDWGSLQQFHEGGWLGYEDVMWVFCAKDYWNDPDILFCPVATEAKLNSAEDVPEWGGTKDAWVTPWAPNLEITEAKPTSSYGVNDWACTAVRSNSNADTSNYWKRIDQKNPQNIPMAFDCAWYSVMPQEIHGPPIDPDEKDHMDGGDTFDPLCLPRHRSKGINVTFIDSSVRWVGIKDLWGLQWHRNFDIGNPWNGGDAIWPDWINDLY